MLHQVKLWRLFVCGLFDFRDILAIFGQERIVLAASFAACEKLHVIEVAFGTQRLVTDKDFDELENLFSGPAPVAWEIKHTSPNLWHQIVVGVVKLLRTSMHVKNLATGEFLGASRSAKPIHAVQQRPNQVF